jgi:hypothetical protein
MTNPTYGKLLVQPDDVVSRIDNLIPIDPVHAVPLVWNARNIDLQVLIDARNEIKRLRAGGCARDQRLTQHCAEAAAAHAEIERLRARVEVLEDHLRRMIELDGTWNEVHAAIDAARAALEVKP